MSDAKRSTTGSRLDFAEGNKLEPVAEPERGFSGSESLYGAGLRFCSLGFSILWRCVCLERTEKTNRDACDLIYGCRE